MASRRTLAKKTAVRGEPIIKKVLAATLEELGQVGYRALRIDDVAARANVHKTTIYRRWPQKADLVRDTMRATIDEGVSLPDTGTLRGDLLVVATRLRDFSLSRGGRALVRMVMAAAAEDEIRKIADSLRSAKEAMPRLIFERARARGEVCSGVDGQLLMTALVGSLHHAIFALGRMPSRAYVEALVDLLLYGVAAEHRHPESADQA